MNIQEVEARLAQEEARLDGAVQAGNTAAVAQAQARIHYYESMLLQLRIEEEGGWKGSRS